MPDASRHRYCSTDCQRIDWRDRGHRKACKKIRDERAAEAARAEAPPSPPKPVVYGPAPRSHADEVRARIVAEHEAARARREANPEPVAQPSRYGSRCPICFEEWDLNETRSLQICCCRRVCGSCVEKIGFAPCPLCRTPCAEDEAEQLARLRRHVENEVPEAVFELGQLYKEGNWGLVRSDKKAAKIWKRGVALGNTDSMVNLGALFCDPRFLKKDVKKSMQLYRMAADRGHELGQVYLGEKLQSMPGGLDEARRLFERAAAQGLQEGKNALEHLLMARAPPTDVKLRFNIGDAVECRITGWASGKIVAFWYRNARMPAGVYAPYQVELEDGELISAPRDSNSCIRARLRFAVGTAVEFFVIDEDYEPGSDEQDGQEHWFGDWVDGMVIEQWIYYESCEGKEKYVLYRVKYGDDVYEVYNDDDDWIRLPAPH